MSKARIAIAGATGTVGREILRLLQDRSCVEGNPLLLASENSQDEEILFHGLEVPVINIKDFDFAKADVVLFATPADVSSAYIPKALEANTFVIDASGCYKGEDDVPAILPDVNGQLLKKSFETKRLVTSPGAAAAPLAMVLGRLSDKVKINKVVTTAMVPVSLAGKSAMDELYAQSVALLGGAGAGGVTYENFPMQVAFNLLPQVGVFEKDARTTAERELVEDMRDVLNVPELDVEATCVYVPTFVGVSQSVYVEFDGEMTPQAAQRLFEGSPGITLLDKPDEQAYSTPFGAAEMDHVFVSRVRGGQSKKALNLWVVADNLRRGSALNMVDITEYLSQNIL